MSKYANRTYTAVGVYEDGEGSYVESVQAPTAALALDEVQRVCAEANNTDDAGLEVIALFEGTPQLADMDEEPTPEAGEMSTSDGLGGAAPLSAAARALIAGLVADDDDVAQDPEALQETWDEVRTAFPLSLAEHAKG